MYKIIGTDGRPYGPISVEQLRTWIAQNRVDARTLVQMEGAQEWKPLSSFPELAELLAAKAPPPIAALPPRPDPGAFAAEILARDYRLEIGSCISRSWNLLTRHFWLMVGASFVMWFIQGSIPFIGGVCIGGLYFLLLKLIRGERAQFGDAFAGFSLAFGQLFLAGLVKGVLTWFGLLFCILPGIYLAVAWVFTLPLVIDKKLDFWPAMEVSRKVVTRHWWAFFGLVLVNFLLVLLGVVCCIVGVYVALPIAFGALAYAYEDIFGRPAANNPLVAGTKPGTA